VIRHDIPDDQDSGPGKVFNDLKRPSFTYDPLHKNPVNPPPEKKPYFMTCYAIIMGGVCQSFSPLAPDVE
jgi:hypothetical protein